MSERIYHCAVTDFSELKNGKRGWPEMPVRYTTDGPCGHVSAPDFRDFTEITLNDIRGCCGILLEYTSNIKAANVVMRGRHIDGKGKVLANSGLPIGLNRNSDYTCIQNYDSELWSSERKAPPGKISLASTILHEWGHGGAASEHAPDNVIALMRAFMDPDINDLQPYDIKIWQSIYGPPKLDKPPSGGQLPSGEWLIKGQGFEMTAKGDLVIYRNGKLQSIGNSPFSG